MANLAKGAIEADAKPPKSRRQPVLFLPTRPGSVATLEALRKMSSSGEKLAASRGDGNTDELFAKFLDN